MITEENEERSMIEPNSRDEPKVRELMKVSINDDRLSQWPPCKHVIAGHYQLTSKMPFKWHVAGGPDRGPRRYAGWA